MRFVDEITLTLNAGKGGNGCVSFRRERFRPKGGPDGGNGGKGGDVVLKASASIQTLADFESRRHFTAENGGGGEGSSRNGRAGKTLVLHVPCGTVVYDASDGEGVADLVEEGDFFVAALGGRGGRGNRVFASSLRRTPRFSEKGGAGESRTLRLELKLIADIGLVGLPNAGKSSILSAVSNAAPKIGDYPFTTLSPNLGVIFTDVESVVLADIPGLIEGASRNKGLGLAFLRHIERTRLILHVLDLSCGNIEEIMNDWRVVRDEMEQYDAELGKRPCVVIGNKTDLRSDHREVSSALAARFAALGMDFVAVSALTGENIETLALRIIEFSREHPRPRGEVRMFADSRVLGIDDLPHGGKMRQIQIITLPNGSFRVIHPKLEKAAERYDLTQEENIARFTKLLRKHRVEELLEAAGATAGASVAIGGAEFDFYPDDAPDDAE